MGQIELGKPLAVETTPIPGFLHIDLTVHGGQPRLVQGELAEGEDAGPGAARLRTGSEQHLLQQRGRGHPGHPRRALGQVRLGATGRVFGAWVDLREGSSFGAVYTCEIDPSVAVFVPRGVGNAYQTLEPNTAYTTWSTTTGRPMPSTPSSTWPMRRRNVPWPIALSEAILSDKDKAHPRLAEVTPFPAPGAEA